MSTVLRLESHDAADRAYEQLKLARRAEKRRGGFGAGILHTGELPAQAERSAVSFALQRVASERGVPFQAGEVNKLVPKYTNALRSLVNSKHAQEHPTLGQDVGHYARIAGQLSNEANDEKDATGRTAINGSSGPGIDQLAGALLHKGASGKSLIEHADAMLERANKNHIPLSRYFANAPQPTKMEVVHGPGGFVDLANPPSDIPVSQLPLEPPGSVVQKNIDADLPGAIKPATDEKVKPASLAPAAKKARREEANAGTPPFEVVDDGAPLPLAETAEDVKGLRGKTRERHDVIRSMVLKQRPAAEIIDTLTKQFAVSPAVAKRTFAQWLDMTRRGMHVERPAKLARERKGQTDPTVNVQPTDLYSGVAPHIAGTRLASHLIKIIKDTAPPIAPTPKPPGALGGGFANPDESPYSNPGREGGLYHRPDAPYGENSGRATLHELAKAALRGEKVKGLNGDIFAAIGKRLTSVGHPLANAYNWHTMDRSMKEDKLLHDFVRRHVVGAKEILDGDNHAAKRELWGKVISSFGREKERMARGYANPDAHAKFWARLRAEYKDFPALSNHERWSSKLEKRLTDSMYRHYTLNDERDTSANIEASKERAGTPNDWRATFEKYKANPNTKHMKFKRDRGPDAADVAIAGVLLKLAREDHKQKWISAKIAKIMSEGVTHGGKKRKVGQKQAAAIAYSMYEQQHKGD